MVSFLKCELEKSTACEEICAEIKKRPEGDVKGFLGYTDEPLVSTDFETCTISSTFDAKAGIMTDDTFVVKDGCHRLSPELGP